MNARDFHDQIVKPTLEEFDLEYSSQRKAFLAAIVVDALVAHIFAEAKQHHLDPFKLLVGRYVRTSGPNKGDISILDFDETNDKDIAFTQSVTSAQSNDTYFRELITNYCDYFKIIRDLAKANKHAELTRGRPLVCNPSTPYGLIV